MIKTKTVTFHAAYNYGAVLQAYSLQQFLLNSGYDNEIIDIRRDDAVGKSRIFSRRFSLKSICLNGIKLLHYPKIKSFRNKFENFVDKELVKTRLYNSYQELADDVPAADYFICGSDSLWNISLKIRPEFFLQFVQEGKKLSYAASFGVEYLDDYQEQYVKNALASFAAISVREDAGLRILDRIGVDNAVRCADPVLLNSKAFWEEKCSDYTKLTPKEKYILVYSLVNSAGLEKTVSALKAKHSLPVYVIAPNGYTKIKGAKKIIHAGPYEFLNLIKNAEYVVCSSFHGVVFSIIFEKKFAADVNPVSGSRTRDMLDVCGLSQNTVSEDLDPDILEKTDYAEVKSKLEAFVAKSKQYLVEVLQ